MPDTPRPPIPTPGEDTLVAHASDPAAPPEPASSDAPASSSEEGDSEKLEPSQPEGAQQQLPLAVALPQQTRRVREQILPAWYARFYQDGQSPEVAELIGAINGALSAADQAMMTQDVNLMRFAYRALESFK